MLPNYLRVMGTRKQKSKKAGDFFYGKILNLKTRQFNTAGFGLKKACPKYAWFE